MRSALRQASKLGTHEHTLPLSSVPVFLCPALLRAPLAPVRRHVPAARSFSTGRPRRQEALAAIESADKAQNDTPGASNAPSKVTRQLPHACPGCGAATQVIDKTEAGYYDIDRRQVKTFLEYDPNEQTQEKWEAVLYKQSLKQVDSSVLEEMGISADDIDAPPPETANSFPETPMCDRCHNLIHHRVGTPIHHPSIDAVKETIAESPHRRNHIYHVLDAADFPLSLIPNLSSALKVPKLRTQNRRAKHKGWVGGDRIAEVSFIITRSDLLAPLSDQVDKLLPYLQDVLRDALGRQNKNARLGNVYLVSAKRGWWTKRVKEDIWSRGGAGWMVGKVNVGKSNLFEVVFPKGRNDEYQNVDVKTIRSEEREAMLNAATSKEELLQIQQRLAEEDKELEAAEKKPEKSASEAESNTVPQVEEEDYDPNALLPAPQPYTLYPVLPLASSLPGTTASPIRIPYGHDRGELIDLPGLARTTPELTTFVKREDSDQLIMTHRIAAHRHVLKPSQSLVLGGGLIRITPTTPNLVFLVHPFVPLDPHITHTEKAIGMQTQTRQSGHPSILLPNTGEKIKSAGTFKLNWDATKQLAGPLTDRMAGKMKPENLPFRIWSCDILIEGVGWVEVSAQTRKPRGWKPVGMKKKDPNHARLQKLREKEEREAARREKFESGGGDAFDRAGVVFGSSERRQEVHEEQVEEEEVPEIEVFSPLGKYVGVRRPMCGSVLGGPKYVSKRERKARPRRSMVSVKKQRKPQPKSAA
ncbi:hypothetical protein BDV96DRAFT_589398 [Lophiotrema nucula]|uniref:Genetic interactor of prohibitins 3, mitochondrial n=1 Tax=Lophiotrema nucula TaxID=690887 RepID=A0A6A5YKK9_9PLEO|nr:hypothetical protein BDV96DRAFT_589398 [Lophiotrema nucula]